MRESIDKLVKLCREGKVQTVLPGHNQVQCTVYRWYNVGIITYGVECTVRCVQLGNVQTKRQAVFNF